MSSETTSFAPTKVYNWTSEFNAKQEYYEWYNSLIRALGPKQLTFTIDAAGMDRARPKRVIEIEPLPTAPKEDHQEYRKYTNEYNNKLQTFYERCEAAMGILRNTLKYDCRASVEAELAYKVIPIDPVTGLDKYTPAEWTPDKQFLAALDKLTAYAPKDAADVSTIRNSMVALDDSNGFHSYAQEFTRLLGILEKAGKSARPSDAELQEWVRNNIKNPVVHTFICSYVITLANPSPTYDVIFQHVEFFLKNMGEDHNPYKSVRSGPMNKPLTNQALVARTGTRCTRCWKPGHTWNDCRVKQCSVCKTSLIGFKICPNISKHNDPDTKFIPKSLRGKKPSEWVLDADTVTPIDQNKNTEKHNQALRSILKKRKGDSDEARDE